MLPHDLPHWKIVHHYFRLWRKDGTWGRLNTALRQDVQEKDGRKRQPSAALDSFKTHSKYG